MKIDDILAGAASAVKSGEYKLAKQLLSECMLIDMENPRVFNLLGIAYEHEGNCVKAGKFYRIAYYLDQTFQPAADNLDRICRYRGPFGTSPVSWGLNGRR